MQLQEAIAKILELEKNVVILKDENEKLKKESEDFINELVVKYDEMESLDWWGRITKAGRIVWDLYSIVKRKIEERKNNNKK